MNTPSVKTIMTIPGVTRETAKVIKRMMTCNMSQDTLEEYPAGAARIRECYHNPSYEDMALHIMNDLLSTHGVEGVALSLYSSMSYANAGDTYARTIFLVEGIPGVPLWHVSCIGDMVEYLERKGIEVN